jgi:hypothetical protein
MVFTAVAQAQKDAPPVLALSFDEGTGKTAKDASGNGLDGSITGATWVTGKHGQTLDFNGVDDGVVVSDDPLLLLPDAGTLMAWSYVHTEAGHASWPRIIIKAGSNGGTTGMDLLFDRGLGYGLRFCIVDCDTIFSPLPTDVWMHLAVTYYGTDIYAYVDGEEVGTVPQRGAALDTSGFDLHIGTGAAFDRPFDGVHDEVRIWDVPLDADTVRWHMDQSTTDFLAVQPGGKSATTWAAVKSATR